MNRNFNSEDMNKISKILQVTPDVVDGCYTWILSSVNNLPRVSVSVFTKIKNSDKILIAVQTALGYLELHNVQGWDEFSSNEIVFFSEENDKLSSLFVSEEGGISLFANTSKNILEQEISEIDPALVLSVMQLSIYNDKS